MNLALFCLLADWAVKAVLKISTVLLKYPTFFSYLHDQNKHIAQFGLQKKV